jgi:hypothetical protein
MSYSQPSDFVRKAVWDQRTSLFSLNDGEKSFTTLTPGLHLTKNISQILLAKNKLECFIVIILMTSLIFADEARSLPLRRALRVPSSDLPRKNVKT